MSDLLDDLNAEQRRAAQVRAAAVVIVAGPGSGKTRVLTRRIAYRMRHDGVPSSRILAVTFTNRAAREMSERVKGLLEEDARVPIGTFHWMCSTLLRRHSHLLGYRRNFHLLTPAESRQVLRDVYRRHSADASGPISGLAAALSGLKSGVQLSSLARNESWAPERLARLLKQYDDRLREMNALDLDDLLALTARLLRDHEGVRRKYRLALTELLVDEYQDTNPVQQQLIELLAPIDGSVVVVGDEDQSIYGWRYADARGTARFLDHFPDAQVVTLERSYRHTKHIIRAANALIKHNRDRVPKRIWTDRQAGERPVCYAAADAEDEAAWVAGEVSRLAAGGLPWRDMAILFRVNAQSRALEDALVRAGVPYRVLSGRSFYARPHVRRAIAYLKLAADGEDVSALESILMGARGIGVKRLAVLRALAEERGVSLPALVMSGSESLPLPHPAQMAVHDLILRVRGIREHRRGSVVSVVDAAIAAVTEDTAAEGADGDAVREDLQELLSMARLHRGGRGTLSSLIDVLALDGEPQEATDGVILVSLHAAKGLEFSAVFLVGLEEGLLPHRRAIEGDEAVEEERRLCYVGMTRARERLFMSYAQGRLLSGHGVSGHPSRFLGEIGLQNVTMRVSPSRRLKPRLSHVRPGDRVLHPRWGAGTVERVEGKGRDTLTTVDFDRSGRRRVQLCHAPLSLLGEGAGDVLAG